MLNILLLSIFQSVFAITLPENEKLTCDEKEGQLQFIEQSPAAIDDDVWRNIELSTRKYDSEMSPQYEQQRKKGLILPKKRVYSLFHVFMILDIVVELIGLLQGKKEQQRYCLEKTE